MLTNGITFSYLYHGSKEHKGNVKINTDKCYSDRILKGVSYFN